MDLQTATQHYMQHCYTLAPKTRKIYSEHLARLTQTLDNPQLSHVNHWTLINFMANLRHKNGQPYSPGYLHQIWRTLHTFFEFCAQEGWLEKNPMKQVPKPKLQHGAKPRLTLNQIAQLTHTVKRATCLEDRNLAIILLMVDSGMRLSEVANLRFLDVRLDDNTAYIQTSKTHTSREVPLTPATIEAITNYMATRPAPANTKESFFLNRYGDPITPGAIHLLLKRLQKHLNFPLHAHLLRHSFANHYNRKGNLRKLQKILGHSRISTTADYYTDPDMADIIAEHSQAAPTAQINKQA